MSLKVTCDVCKKEHLEEVNSLDDLPPPFWGSLVSRNRPKGEMKLVCMDCMRKYFEY